MISRLIILACAILLALSLREKIERLQQPVENAEFSMPNTAQKEMWFDQVLDHYDYKETKYWKQRYFVIDNYFKPGVGPVFLYICGEYTCSGVPEARQWVVLMAQRLQGLILTLEHRYYGESMPFGKDSLTVENMRLLNSEQALKDLAYFTERMNANHMYKIDRNPWVSVGGSYPGALSAWYRYKYPHLTIGSIASSAVINAIADFKNFDEQMFISANKSGDYCWQALNNSNTRVESILKSSEASSFKAQFEGASVLKDNQFLFFWIDSIVGEIQYGKRSSLCSSLKGKSADDQFAELIKIVKTNDVHEYGSVYLQNASYYYEKKDSSRAWIFQCCTEYGWWQTASDMHPLRSSQVNIDFYRQYCKESFGEALWPDTERKNIEYGGLDIKAYNLLMANGDEDPWKWASLLKSQDKVVSRVANCSDCAHCVDLYTPATTDSYELRKVRDEQYLYIQEWIEEYWRSIKKTVGKTVQILTAEEQ